MNDQPPSYPPPGQGGPGPEQGQPTSGQQPPAYGQQPPTSGQQPGYGQQPSAYGDPAAYGQPPAWGEAPRQDRRPGTVTAACVLTWVFSSITLFFGLAMFAAVSADRDEFVRRVESERGFEDLDVSADALADGLAQGSLVIAVLALAAIVTAVLAFRRSRGGRAALIVLSVIGALISLVASVAVVPFLWVVVCIATIVLLFAGGASAWYARR